MYIGFIVVILIIIGIIAYLPIVDNTKDRLVMIMMLIFILMAAVIGGTVNTMQHIYAVRVLIHKQLPIIAYYQDQPDGTRTIEFKDGRLEKSSPKVHGPIE